jgi:hypothetical protein
LPEVVGCHSESMFGVALIMSIVRHYVALAPAGLCLIDRVTKTTIAIFSNVT